MQTQYVDKHEAELRTAIEKADYIANVDYYKIPGYRYVGAAQVKSEKRHYYYNPGEDKYYYESDFAREMRLKIRNKRFQNFTKK
ncbi:MAG: hypothetical protein IJA54_08075 [Tyzzerella sp.]|nr:hypothetical protein [Tyzzerella sp.]